MLIIHLDACIYYSISYALGFDSDKWVLSTISPEKKSHADNPDNLDYNKTLSDMYLASLFWACLMLTKIAEVEPPDRIVEYVFHTINVMIGILIFASVVSLLASFKCFRIENLCHFQGGKYRLYYIRYLSQISDDLLC